ncbi:Phloem protein 2-like A1 [Apostasia shenzhenica]|uniref:Phloem protein 2-like A1 n=1 Tax=Apostasia shenzhenica TaxID=1088818 RepID=A0A2I0B4T5_9ASPA|nr:Phloem protein 2-like A1 [Apostasia shenzhenica]
MGQNYSHRLPSMSSSDASNSIKAVEKVDKPDIQYSNSSKEKVEKQATVSLANGAKTEENLSMAVEVAKEGKENKLKKPHRYDDIIKEADKTLQGYSEEIKYWIEERTGYNCFMLFARALLITWGDDRYWSWLIMRDNSNGDIEVARLIDVCWLEVRGNFNSSYLTPGVTYEVMFIVMMEPGYGLAVPVNLKLKLPTGSIAERREVLREKPLWQWFELKVGEYMASAELSGEIIFSLEETQGGQWKRGLVIKGVIIRPKN